MNRIKSRWLAIGSLIAAALASAILGVVTLSGFGGGAGGDLAFSSAMGSGVSLEIALVGTLILLSLELAHVTSRRRPARVMRALVAPQV